MSAFQVAVFDIADPRGRPVPVAGWRGKWLGIYQRIQPEAQAPWYLTHLRTGGCPLTINAPFPLALAVAEALDGRFLDSWDFGEFGKPKGATRARGVPVFAFLESVGVFVEGTRELSGAGKIFLPDPAKMPAAGIEIEGG